VIEAFFNHPVLRVRTTCEKFNRPLTTRTTTNDTLAYNAVQLIECLKAQKTLPVGPVGPFPDSLGILALTGDELYAKEWFILKPAQEPPPLPEEALIPSFVSVKDNIGVCTTANLRPPCGRPTQNLKRLATDEGYVKANLDRITLRRLLLLLSHECCRILGFKTCCSHRCLCYNQPFDVDAWSLFLCRRCDAKLASWSKEGEEGALQRLNRLAQVLGKANESVGPVLAYGHRRHGEFEKELDWLGVAARELEERRHERKEYILRSTGLMTKRKRSLRNLMSTVHRKAPPLFLTRAFSTPDLTKHCLLDMQSPLFRDSAPLGPWKGQGLPDKVINAKHSTGGCYVELGGSLRPKRIKGLA